MADEQKRERDNDPLRDGIRTVTGVLGALKDAIEDTFDELRERGDLTPDRAREAARSTMRKAQDSFDDMRDRVDFVSRKEFDALRAELDAVRARLDALEGAAAPAGGSSAADAAGAAGGGTRYDSGPGNFTGASGTGGTGAADQDDVPGSGRRNPADGT